MQVFHTYLNYHIFQFHLIITKYILPRAMYIHPDREPFSRDKRTNGQTHEQASRRIATLLSRPSKH